MSGLVENFIRRVEKLVLQRATVPPVGTNHVDDTWYDTDIYPGELGINLSLGSLYTSDGLSVIDLNREDMIISGMVLSKSTAGVNKLTVSSGQVRMNGRNYYLAKITLLNICMRLCRIFWETERTKLYTNFLIVSYFNYNI